MSKQDDFPSGYNLPPGCFQEDIDEHMKANRSPAMTDPLRERVFTDDDLKRLKKVPDDVWKHWAMPCDTDIPALLARLEAVEHYASSMRTSDSYGYFEAEYQAWRTSRGEVGG